MDADDTQAPWSARRLLFTSAAAGSVAFVAGSLLYLSLLGSDSSAATLWSLLPAPAIWTALIAVVALAAARVRVDVAPAIAFALAPIASILTSVWEDGGALFMGDLVTTAILMGRTVGFTASAAVGIAVARGFARHLDHRVWFGTLSLVAILVAMVALFALPLQFLLVYFSLGGTTPQAPPEAGTRYVVTVTVGAAAVLVAIACAAVARRPALIWWAAVTLLLGLCVAAALPVPRDRFEQQPAPEPRPAWTYVPCYGEGRGCEGG